MRLVAWYIRQGGGSRLPRIAEALKRHNADIVVLSEYRGGSSALRLCAALHALGYRHATTLVPPYGCSGVLVAVWRTLREHGVVDVGVPEPYQPLAPAPSTIPTMSGSPGLSHHSPLILELAI